MSCERSVFYLSAYLLLDTNSYAQIPPGTGTEPLLAPNIPTWRFFFKEVRFDTEYNLVPLQTGPPLIPPHRTVASSEMILNFGRVALQTNPLDRSYSEYKLKIYDANGQLRFVEVQPFPANSGSIANMQNINQPIPEGLASPPIYIKVDIKGANGIWYTSPNSLKVGSETEGTDFGIEAQRQIRVDVTVHWTYGIPSPSSIPDHKVGIENIADVNFPWQAHTKIWRSTFNADSSFGFHTTRNFVVQHMFHDDQLIRNWYAWFMSAIIAVNERPEGIIYLTFRKAKINPH